LELFQNNFISHIATALANSFQCIAYSTRSVLLRFLASVCFVIVVYRSVFAAEKRFV